MKERTNEACKKCNKANSPIQTLRKEFWGNRNDETDWNYTCDRCGFSEIRAEKKENEQNK